MIWFAYRERGEEGAAGVNVKIRLFVLRPKLRARTVASENDGFVPVSHLPLVERGCVLF